MAATGTRTGDTGEVDIRPSVARRGGDLPVWLLAAGVGGIGLALFLVLESQRHERIAPNVKAGPSDVIGGRAPAPTLYVPPEIVAVAPPVAVEQPPAAPPQTFVQPPPPPPPQIVYVPQRDLPVVPPPPPPQRASGGPVLVIDNGSPTATETPGGGAATAPAAASAGGTNTARARAGAFANRSTTVAQGTLIPAVLESALDSTRPGFARAIVSRDIRGFDGTRVLIPRGSRLIGEYRSETAPGQKRALVNWTRLIRPDGATISIGSPAADPLGGTGIPARVNSHFFERFAGAFLQSALDIGVNLAARSSNSPVIVALPGAVQNSTGSIIQPQQITPTLKVSRGTSISVFVARDLDFTGVEAR